MPFLSRVAYAAHPLVHFRFIQDVLGAVGVIERAKRLLEIGFCGRDRSNYASLGAAAERILQKASEFRLTGEDEKRYIIQNRGDNQYGTYRYGTCSDRLVNALITLPSVSNDWLIILASRARSFSAPERPIFSDPARSTRFSLPTLRSSSPSGVASLMCTVRGGNKDTQFYKPLIGLGPRFLITPCRRNLSLLTPCPQDLDRVVCVVDKHLLQPIDDDTLAARVIKDTEFPTLFVGAQ
ncbi:hypothetical protein BC937DRAFT_88563 [Endogone sp. FLAS-F59071]|nr:hypothetical protein BC937DRAFT_88563 [Endogone sp. FLAS-F59071]|eukprot:RUS22532.1 hypothetical protein BC937DRAFT_88563 [Endogone sp. FLAS-F59071]